MIVAEDDVDVDQVHVDQRLFSSRLFSPPSTKYSRPTLSTSRVSSPSKQGREVSILSS